MGSSGISEITDDLQTEIEESTGIPEIIRDIQTEIEEAAIDAANYAFNMSEIQFSFTCAPKLFHYCSLETFYSIIESNCFWLSHPKFMNDISEYKYSIRTTKKCLCQYNQKIPENDALKKFFTQIESSIDEYESGFKGFDENKYEKLYFFTCFTSDGDNLPMWSIYRGKNIGLSIELDFSDKDYFVSSDKKGSGEHSPFDSYLYPVIFTDIEYKEDKIRETINIFLNRIRDYYNTRQPKFYNYQILVDKIISEEIVKYLINISSYLKNSNFNYEKETRLLLRKYDPKDVKFRVRDKFIVPYIEFPLEEKEDENKNKEKKKFNKPIIPIKSITISPNAEEPKLVIASIRAFLNHKGYNINKINIEHSNIPFKPR